MSILISLCILLALYLTWSLRRDSKKPVAQFDPEAPTIEPAAILGPDFADGIGATNRVDAATPIDLSNYPTFEPETSFTLRPNWDEAPEWAMWAAQDANGAIAFFASPPRHSDYFQQWKNTDGTRWDFTAGHDFRYSGAPANPNWRQAIEQRPAKTHEQQCAEWDRQRKAIGGALMHRLLTPAPERDNCELISREELAELRQYKEAHADVSQILAEVLRASREHCKAPGNVRKFQRLAELAGVEL